MQKLWENFRPSELECPCCENQNHKVRGAKNSFHVLGRAFDIQISQLSTQEKEDLVTKAISLGFRGIGIYDKHIHIDDREKEARWVGKSS
jgi:uncharacterized protein YcbK (DUF882 family)